MNDVESWWREQTGSLRLEFLNRLPLKPDGSASPRTLSARTAVKRTLPASAVLYEVEGIRLACLDTTSRIWAFEMREPNHEARSFAISVRDENTTSEELGESGIIWLALDDLWKPRFPLVFTLQRTIEVRDAADFVRRQALESSSFDQIGWHDSAVADPTGEPDPRISLVARFPTGRLTPGDIAEDAVKSARTLLLVPDAIAGEVKNARNLYLQGWHQWEFFTLATREAILTLEKSLSLLATETGGQPAAFKAMIDRVSVDPAGCRLLSDWERYHAHLLRQIRNEMIHGTDGPPVQWISEARSALASAVRLINLMWARQRASVPRELGWEEGPLTP